MNRREFLLWVGVGSLATSLPVAIAACTPQNEKSEAPAAPKRVDGYLSIGTVAELQQKGYILNKDVANAPVLVVSKSANPKTISAVNPTCTHKGCTVDWKKDKKTFVCPCHKAEYSADGKVLKGPAKKDLATYQTKIEGSSVLVKAT
ncbi:MAG TPA: ubiquinol-cytochrome c reductase iron-sulfur subunit [Waterburya sp.]|jgi:cytochrome b6-f complex iron-sulfur subunit